MFRASADRRLAALVSTLALLALSPPSLRAAKEPPPEEPTFFEAIDVNVVSIDVIVTDRDGTPISGLSQEDFEVLEDGKPVEVTNFYAEKAVAPSAAAGGPAADAAPSATSAVPDDQRLYLIILVDNHSITVGPRNRVLRAIQGFLDQRLRPDDRLFLASYEGGGIKIREEPSNDPHAVSTALEELVRETPWGQAQRMELQSLLREIDQAAMPEDPLPGSTQQTTGERQDTSQEQAMAVYGGVRVYTQRRYEEVRATLSAVETFVDSLAGLPGRKALLFVSGGLPMRPGEVVYRALELKYRSAPALNQGNPLEAIGLDASPQLTRLVRHANANRVTFYPLVVTDDSSFIELRGGVWTNDLATAERFNNTTPLSDLAGATGGLAALDPINPDPLLNRLRDDLASYYSLGYVSPTPRTDKTHKVEVRVKRPGLKVRHRETYQAKTGIDKAIERTLSALLLGEEHNPLGLAVELGDADEVKGKKQLEVETTVKFPIANLVLLPREHYHEGKVNLFLSTRDRRGRSSEVVRVAVPIRVPNEQLLSVLSQTAAYKTKLLMRPEEHTVAVGLRDELGNADSAIRTVYTPQGAGPRAAGGAAGDRR
jgi:VWFA-related protein